MDVDALYETDIACPYCGESIAVLIDCSEPEQEYIEDCQVCCRPILFTVMIEGGGEPRVWVRSEDDVG